MLPFHAGRRLAKSVLREFTQAAQSPLVTRTTLLHLGLNASLRYPVETLRAALQIPHRSFSNATDEIGNIPRSAENEDVSKSPQYRKKPPLRKRAPPITYLESGPSNSTTAYNEAEAGRLRLESWSRIKAMAAKHLPSTYKIEKFTMSILRKLTKKQLVEELELAQQPVNGKKEDLFLRLANHLKIENHNSSRTRKAPIRRDIPASYSGSVYVEDRALDDLWDKDNMGIKAVKENDKLEDDKGSSVRTSNADEVDPRMYAFAVSPEEVGSLLLKARITGICIMYLREEECHYTRAFVIGTGRSSRHLFAAANAVGYLVRQRVREVAVENNDRRKPCTIEPGHDWVAVDAGSVVVHLFREEPREEYDLEGLWGPKSYRIKWLKDIETPETMSSMNEGRTALAAAKQQDNETHSKAVRSMNDGL